MLSGLRKSGSFLIPDNAPSAYAEHMASEIKKEIRNPMTGRTRMVWKQVKKHNHLRDAELMNIVGAILHGLMDADPAPIEDVNSAPDSAG